jgi:phosphatidylserine decarboxylase
MVERQPAITCVQPGGGWVLALELGWGRLRRWGLRTFRPGYVARYDSAM